MSQASGAIEANGSVILAARGPVPPDPPVDRYDVAAIVRQIEACAGTLRAAVDLGIDEAGSYPKTSAFPRVVAVTTRAQAEMKLIVDSLEKHGRVAWDVASAMWEIDRERTTIAEGVRKLATLRAEIEARATAAGDQVVAAAEAEARRIIDAAEAEARKIVETADMEAALVRTDEKAGRRKLEKTQGKLKAAREELRAKVATSRETSEHLDGHIARKLRALNRIEVEIARMEAVAEIVARKAAGVACEAAALSPAPAP